MAKKLKAQPINNFYAGEGANGGCFFEIADSDKPQHARLCVGWSCVIVHDEEIPVTWLSEIIAVAKDHEGGIAGFLLAHGEGYALACDPPPKRLINEENVDADSKKHMETPG